MGRRKSHRYSTCLAQRYLILTRASHGHSGESHLPCQSPSCSEREWNERPVVDHSRVDVKDLKLSGFGELSSTYNLYISDFFFYIGDLSLGQFRDLPIISQWE